jgi:NACHT domain
MYLKVSPPPLLICNSGLTITQDVLIVSTSETEKDLINRLVDYSRFVKDDLDQFRYSRIKTTCQWLLDEPKFKDWLTEPRPFLWLSGPAGFGKSFLTSKVVEFLKEKVGKDQQGGGNDALLVYFFCRATDATQRSLKNGMWAMIGQLADQDKEYAKEIGPLLKSTRTNSPQSSPTIPKIWRRFLHDFKHIFKRRPIFMVVDGLDECERTERQEFLQEAFRFCFENLDSLRIFCSSRPEVLREIDEIETPEERSIVPPTIVVSSQTKSDIECFVNAKLRRTRFAKDKKMRSKVQSSVVSNAKGMFLWADLTMKEVSHAQTAEDVDDVLNSILDTHNLNELYDNVLGSLYKNSNRRQAQIINEILAWVTNALEDLNFSKLKQALEFGMGTKIFSLKEEIERCGSLFEISGLTQVNPVKNGSTIHEESDTGGGSSDKILSSGEENSSGTDASYYPEDTGADEHYWNAIVRIRHTTLQEYFKRKEQSSPLKVDQERVHELLAITCMKAIINVADEDDPPEFLKYAYHNWMEHLNKVTVDHGSVSRIYPLLSTIFRRWDIIKTWLIRDHTHCSLPSLERINIILGMGGEFQGNIPETITTNSSTGQHQNLAKSHSFLLDMVVETATKDDFFHTLPRLGDERSIQDYSSLIASFVGLYSAVSKI